MRLVLLLSLLALATPSVAQDRPAAFTNAEACLEEQVNDALLASVGATDTADFLLSYLCAGHVATAARYERNMAVLTAFQGMSQQSGELSTPEAAALTQGVIVDPMTGELTSTPDNPAGSTAMMAIMGFAGSQGTGWSVPVSLREFAGRLIVERKR